MWILHAQRSIDLFLGNTRTFTIVLVYLAIVAKMQGVWILPVEKILEITESCEIFTLKNFCGKWNTDLKRKTRNFVIIETSWGLYRCTLLLIFFLKLSLLSHG